MQQRLTAFATLVHDVEDDAIFAGLESEEWPAIAREDSLDVAVFTNASSFDADRLGKGDSVAAALQALSAANDLSLDWSAAGLPVNVTCG
eukprot:jgi/Ulvmu1/7205/UM034_0114.1